MRSKQKRLSISACPSKHISFTVAVCHPYGCPPGEQAKTLYSQHKLRLSLGCEGCSHLEWIPHAAQQEAEPFLCSSVSSTLHQDCFVCHQVIKVADCSAVSGVVVLKLGQQELSLRQDTGSWCPYTPALAAKIPSLPLPRHYRENDIATHNLAFLFSNSGGK